MTTLISICFPVLVYTFCALGLFVVGFSIVVKILTSPYPDVYRSKKEKKFYNPSTQSWEDFPSIEDPFQVHLSVVVPAYNEEERLPKMLDECVSFLENDTSANSNFKYEIIVVSDGSRDKTVQVALKYAEKYRSEKVRVLELETNRGKGGAVYMGVQSARGALILFADADGATKFEDLRKLELAAKKLINYLQVLKRNKLLQKYLWGCAPEIIKSVLTLCTRDRCSLVRGCLLISDKVVSPFESDYRKEPELAAGAEAIICGSRAHLEKEAIATRSLFRNILMHGFHFLVWFFAVRTIKDTQCGFKLLTRRAANRCFKSLHVRRWAFDVELLYIAEQLNIPISEIAVRWTEIEGSKLVPVWSWLQMGKDLCFIWFKYKIGAWKLIDCNKNS